MMNLNDAPFPTRRVVLLGASNLVRSIATVVETCRGVWGTPVDIIAALGHGRSYGMENRVLGRTLPGILQCGLWRALEKRPTAETAALLTDIGNDLLYGVGVPQIVDWVETCLDRLVAVHARMVITALPVASLELLGRWRFRLLRTILFPRCRLEFATMRRRALDLNRQITELAGRYGVTLICPPRSWYGFDPIHIRFRSRVHAWPRIMRSWSHEGSEDEFPGSTALWIYLRLLPPLHRRFFGIEKMRQQPSGCLPDGSLISLF